jgi:hypothetical protein
MLKTALYRICFQLLIIVTRLLFGLPLSSRGETRVQSNGRLQVNQLTHGELATNQQLSNPNYSTCLSLLTVLKGSVNIFLLLHNLFAG